MQKRNRLPAAPRILRRETLKRVCLIPAGAFAARLLGACSEDAPIANVGSPSATGMPVATPSAPEKAPEVKPSTPPAPKGPMGSTAGAPAPAAPAQPMKPAMPAAPVTPPPASPMAGAAAMDPATPMGGAAGMNGGMVDAVAGADVKWATGGTKAMMADYPDPFGDDMSNACMVYPAQTLGPCYARGPMMREDISDGQDGLPTRLSFLVIDADCKPVPNASIDIWAAGPDGIYSSYSTGTICNPGREPTTGKMFARGVQISDEGGRANFNMVFPGWYRGRTLHIHFTIRIDGREYLTSQLYFDDSLVDEILMQGIYASRGRRDTTNASDFIFRSGGATVERVVFETAKRPDGSLHAWKVLALG